MTDLDRLRDMVEHLALIEEHGRRASMTSPPTFVRRSAILRWLEIVGEAAANVSVVIREAHPEVPWREIVGMRNRLIHAYPDVNLALVWGVIERDGPSLRAAIEAIFEAGDE